MESRSKTTAVPRQRLWLQSRESLLLLTFAALALAFTVTGFAARLYHGSRGALAQHWYRLGMSEMNAGRPSAAVSDFQAALIYGREDVSGPQQRIYELSLAEALSAAGSSSASSREEATSYLLDLRQQSPGDGEVNLALARLAAQSHDDASAREYYDDAVAGSWQGDSAVVGGARNEARQEFARYLALRGDQAAADAVTAGFTATPVPDNRSRAKKPHP